MLPMCSNNADAAKAGRHGVCEHHAGFGQDRLDVAQAQAEAMIQPDRLLDDLGGKAKAPTGIGTTSCGVSALRYLKGDRMPSPLWL
jgi:hypothetical protein